MRPAACFVVLVSACNDGEHAAAEAARETAATPQDSGDAEDPLWTACGAAPDHDRDGFAAPLAPRCRLGGVGLATTRDCDDADARRNPGARERCDGVDNDCNGGVDDAAADAGTWYTDADGDGYGAGAGTLACERPLGSVSNNLDCDDTTAARRPGAAEARNELDDDCDVLVDEPWIEAGTLVVSEVARQPYAGGTGTSTNANAQWFEIYNPGAAAVNLAGWYVAEQDGDGFFLPLEPGLVVESGGTRVLCYDDATFADPTLCDWTWGDAEHGAPWFDTTYYFDRDEDLVALLAAGLLVDEVHWTYDDASGYWPRNAKYSMGLDENTLSASANDDLANWCSASTATTWSDPSLVAHPDYGTPNAVNGPCD